MNLTLKIWRQKDVKSKGSFITYKMDDVSQEMSFLEMLDALNKKLVEEDKDPVAFDHDCREGICGSCGMYINGHLQ
jgi:succinate dehydrogenase / fumarate reductase iron-sulfur subunit